MNNDELKQLLSEAVDEMPQAVSVGPQDSLSPEAKSFLKGILGAVLKSILPLLLGGLAVRQPPDA